MANGWLYDSYHGYDCTFTVKEKGQHTPYDSGVIE